MQRKTRDRLASFTPALLAIALIPASLPASAAPKPDPRRATIDRLLEAYHDLGQLEGTVLLAEKGQVLYQRSFGQAHREWQVANTNDTAYRIASLSKSFTAALVLKLAEEGQLRLEDTLAAYVPGLRKDIAEQVTIHHLLSHTSGLVDYVNVP